MTFWEGQDTCGANEIWNNACKHDSGQEWYINFENDIIYGLYHIIYMILKIINILTRKSYCCPGTDICFNVDDWYHRLQRLTDATAPPSGNGGNDSGGTGFGGGGGGVDFGPTNPPTTFGPTYPPTTMSGGTGGNSNRVHPNPCEPGCECAPDYHRNILTG